MGFFKQLSIESMKEAAKNLKIFAFNTAPGVASKAEEKARMEKYDAINAKLAELGLRLKEEHFQYMKKKEEFELYTMAIKEYAEDEKDSEDFKSLVNEALECKAAMLEEEAQYLEVKAVHDELSESLSAIMQSINAAKADLEKVKGNLAVAKAKEELAELSTEAAAIKAGMASSETNTLELALNEEIQSSMARTEALKRKKQDIDSVHGPVDKKPSRFSGSKKEMTMEEKLSSLEI